MATEILPGFALEATNGASAGSPDERLRAGSDDMEYFIKERTGKERLPTGILTPGSVSAITATLYCVILLQFTLTDEVARSTAAANDPLIVVAEALHEATTVAETLNVAMGVAA
jgi:hypothetical protein